MKISSLNKKMIIAGLAGLLLLILLCTFTVLSGRKNLIAFYGLNEVQVEAIKTELLSEAETLNISVEFVEYDQTKTLSSQLFSSNRPMIVFAPDGYAANTAVEKADKRAGVPSTANADFTTSMRDASKKAEGKDIIKALPILCDNFEILIDTTKFRNTEMKNLATWNDLEHFLSITRKSDEISFAFAADDGKELLNTLGALAEAFDGTESYFQAAEILKETSKKSFNAVQIASALADNPDSPLATAVRALKKWYKAGFISMNTLDMSNKDMRQNINHRIPSGAFMSASQQRLCKDGIIHFTSIYVPSERPALQRRFTSPAIYAVPLVKSSAAQKLVLSLATKERQENLSRKTGLAPVFARCKTPDKQADDIRYWIAGTNSPLAGLGNEVFYTPDQLHQLTKELTSRISH